MRKRNCSDFGGMNSNIILSITNFCVHVIDEISFTKIMKNIQRAGLWSVSLYEIDRRIPTLIPNKIAHQLQNEWINKLTTVWENIQIIPYR